MPSVLRGSKMNLYKYLPWFRNLLRFLSLRKQLCTPRLGRKRDSPLLSPTWQPQKLYPAPRRGDTWLYHLRREWQAAGRKSSELSLRNSQGHSGWVSLVQAPCNQTCCSMGTLYLNRNKENLISASCVGDKTNSTDLTQTYTGISDAGLKLLLVTTMVLLLKF